jgi:hypothetical protein
MRGLLPRDPTDYLLSWVYANIFDVRCLLSELSIYRTRTFA